jgi:homoserine kinase type II
MTDKRYERWLTEVSEAFALDDRAGVSPLRGGTSSVSFIIDAAERVIVSFCVDLTVQRVERLVTLLEHFEQHGFLTNRILRSKSGGPIHIVDGVPAIVKAFIDGKTVSVVDEAKAYRIGVVLAQLHKIPVPPEFAWDHSMNPEAMARLAEAANDPSFAAWIVAAVRALPKDWGELPTGIVHGDLFPDNLLEVHDGSLIPIDFEEACRYPLVFDIGMSLVGLANTRAFTLQTIASLLAGYESKRELLPSERESVPTMVECSSAMTACWRYDLGHAKKLSNHGELRDWRDMQAIHAHSLEWRRSGVWSTLFTT